MITIEMSGNGVTIGRLLENEAARLAFDVSGWMEEYPNGQISVLCRRPKDADAYPVPIGQISIEDGRLYWVLSSADLAQTGSGLCELILTDGDVRAKSEIYGIWIQKALDGSAEPPEPWESWVDEVIEKANDAADSADAAGRSAEQASESVRQAALIVATYGLRATLISGNKYKMKYDREEE